MYYLLLKDLKQRTWFIEQMKEQGIHCVFHYVPLHTAPEGVRRTTGSSRLPVTCDLADRLVRLPLWVGLNDLQSDVIESVIHSLQ